MRRGLGALGLLSLLASACAGAKPPPAKPKDKPPVEGLSTTIVSPARWDYHPAPPTAALAAVKLDKGCVFTAEGGQRWTSTETKVAGGRTVCSGRAEASAFVAGEELGTAIRRADGTWIFVGASGALMEAADPLGPFTRTVGAPEPLMKVSGAGAGVLATTLAGALVRWDQAAGWRPAVSGGPIAAARVFDVAAGEGGRALALAFPEQLWTSEDGGASWAKLDAPPLGARQLGRTAGGELGAVGMLETLVWKPGATPPYQRGTERVQAQAAMLDVETGRAPSAAAVQQGRAVLDGDRYYEAVRPEGEVRVWQIARGRIEGRLELVDVKDSEACSNLRLGARGAVLYAACVASDHPEVVTVQRSADRGATWGEPLELSAAEGDALAVAVSADGGALITGVCRPTEGGCKPGAPLRLRMGPPEPGDAGADAGTRGAGARGAGTRGAGARDAGARDAGAPDAGARDGGADEAAPGEGLHATAVNAPQLSGAALLTTFSLDGRSAYFLGRRGKDDRIHLFVSRDGGATFTPRVLEGAPPPRPPRPRGDDEGEEQPAVPEGPDSFDVDDNSSLRPGEDGTLGLQLLRSRGDQAYVLADDDGRVMSVGSAPLDAMDDEGRSGPILMSGHGRRVIAMPMMIGDPGMAGVWESIDGGVTWDRQPAPQVLMREYERGQLGFTCGLGGCLIGDNVTRLGWGGQQDAGASERAPDPPGAAASGVLTPIVCDLAKGPWSHVDHPAGGMSYGAPLPGIHEAARGRAAWSVLTVDKRTGAIGAAAAMLPESGEGEPRVVTKQLVGPRAAGQRTATHISATQHEGYAVVRVSVPAEPKPAPPAKPDPKKKPPEPKKKPPEPKKKPPAPMRGVEVAWENYFEGTSGRARIADAGVFEPGDVGYDDELRAALTSITSRGIFVHPHRRERAPAFFIDASGRVTPYQPHAWPSSSPVGGSLNVRADASALSGELLDVALLGHEGEDGWTTVALAHHKGTGTGASVEVNAIGLLPPRPPASPLWAYSAWSWTSKTPVGVSVLVADAAHDRAWGHFIAFRSDGSFAPPVPVPTLLDLGERPRGCSAAERASTPRVNTPLTSEGHVLFPGARHPVLVREPRAKNAVGVDEAYVLLTAGAVLQGTPSSPCVSAWEAPALGNGAAAALILGDLGRAWMFRFTSDTTRAAKPGDSTPTLEYRAMSCRYDPAAHVPEAVWTEGGVPRP